MNKESHDKLIKHAIEAVIALDTQLNILLDGYDFYINRYPPQTRSDHLVLADAQVSIKALGELPKSLTMQLDDWKHGREPQLSAEGFEVFILNEFSLHMFSIATLLDRQGIDSEQLNQKMIQFAFNVLRATNKMIRSNLKAT